jgi:hypothetical protein
MAMPAMTALSLAVSATMKAQMPKMTAIPIPMAE